MKKSILFVDDDPSVLSLYELMFQEIGGEWDVFTARDGEQALQTLQQHQVEVLITDMRMPRMNGAQLLNLVQERHPETARIILSGYAEQEVVAKCVGAAHQYLMKPCSLQMLRETLNRVCALDIFLRSEKLKSLVSRMSVLPSLPSLYFRVIHELQSPNASLDRIGDLVSMDPGMSAKILQLVNSAFFGFSRKVASPTEAIGVLGVSIVRSLALCIHAFSCFHHGTHGELSFEQIWSHCLLVGVFARRIASTAGTGIGVSDEAFVAGLLHDVGKLMLISNMPQEYKQVQELVRETNMPLIDAEGQVFEATHADVGAYLLGLWGLPVSVVEAVALHHSPNRSVNHVFSPLTAVHAANVLDHERSGTLKPGVQLDTEYLMALGLENEPDFWRKLVAEDEQG
jgi:putative nucleotidyltransferase with HDIG domain